MANLFGDTYGFIHLIASLLALITGFMVLVMKKGTKSHVKVGYIYVLSMALLIATSFMIYRLFNGWGIFHYTSIISLITIALGMISIWTKKPVNSWKYLHFSFMYWSVVGLYAAFAAEILTRIPETPFFGMVGIATAVIMLIGGIYFGMNKAKWMIIFGIDKK
ncbi:DUF2306 domain-containing protein [Fulvivirgaceae bacterium LMO-SS25]